MKLVDLTGKRFGRFLVIKRVKAKSGTKWLCLCDCGKEKEVFGHHLKTGNTSSCGCLGSELLSERQTTHGMSDAPEFHAWTAMIARCTNKKSKAYKNYGGRGVKVCDLWLNDFMAFYEHIGPRPSPKHSVDRIDNNDDYKPGNVKWSTAVEQNNNKRTNILISAFGNVMTRAQWSRVSGIHSDTIRDRLNAGVDSDDALTVQPKKGRRW